MLYLFGSRLIVAVGFGAMAFASSAFSYTLNDVDCMKSWITAASMKYQFNIVDGVHEGSPFRLFSFPKDPNKLAVIVFNENTKKVGFGEKVLNQPTEVKFVKSYSDLLRIARAKNEGCGAVTALNLSNPRLAKAVRGELIYPASYNKQKLESNWLARLNLEIFNQRKYLLDNLLDVSRESILEIDRVRQAQMAGIEAMKAATDIAMIGLTDPKDVSDTKALAAVALATFAGQTTSISSALSQEPALVAPAADLMKASAEFMYFTTDFSANKTSLVSAAANGVKSYLGYSESNEGWVRATDSLSAGINCMLDRFKVGSTSGSCVAGQIELIAKASVDATSSYKIFNTTKNYRSVSAARDYLEVYYSSAGDQFTIFQKTGVLYPLDLGSVADTYASGFGAFEFDRNLFMNTVSEFFNVVNMANSYYRSRIER